MPRGNAKFYPGGGFSSRRSGPSPARHTSTAQAPPRQHSTPLPAQQQSGGFLSNMAGTFMTGIGLGAGSEVGHQAMRGLFGGGSHTQAAPQQQSYQQGQSQPQACQNEGNSFTECLKRNNDISLCQSYLDALKNCQSASGVM